MTQADMTQGTNGEQEAILARIVTGDLSPEAPEVRTRLEADPEFARELGQLLALIEHLDRAGARERRTLQAASSLKNAPGDERVASTLEGLLPRSPRPKARLRLVQRMGSFGVAAAALLMVAWSLNQALTPKGTQEGEGTAPLLLGAGLQIHEPEPGSGPLESLAWKADVPTGGWYEVRVWEASQALGTPARIVRTHLSETRWTPTIEELELLAPLGRLRIEVHSVGPDGQPYKSGDVEFAFDRP